MVQDGSLYFRVIGRGRRDLYRAQWRDGTYETPVRSNQFELLQSDTLRVWGAEPAPDERSFFLTVGRRSSPTQEWGPADVYTVSVRRDGSWSPPRKLDDRINTGQAEGAMGVSPDGRYLYFTRGGRSILRVPVPATAPSGRR
jgi:hypothetical protein